MGTIPNSLLKITKYVSKKAKYARDRDEIKPRNNSVLIVGVVARISGGPRQKEMSLDDQVDHAKEIISEYYAGPVELRIVATKGKGEDLERPELKVIEQQLRTRELDLLVCEDIGRVVRGAAAARLCGIAVDHGTRVLAPNDCIDTLDEDWESDVMRACEQHAKHNSHCSKRIKQKKQNRFRKFGGSTPCLIAGYEKPSGADTYADWRKIQEATAVIQKGKHLLKETLNCSRVAKYFNRVGFKPGPYSRRLNGKWDGKMVRRFYGNSLIAGKPGRGYRHTIKHHERGKRISVPNTDGPDFFDAPHLAHLDYDEFVELNELLRQKNSKLGRKKVNGIDPRMRVPRKTTVYPSQHARCLYCGFHHVRGANGLKDNIYCSNARANGCWASCSVNCGIAAIKTMDAITSMLYDLDSFDAHFRELVDRAHVEREGASAEKWKLIDAEETRIDYELTHLIQSLKEFGPSPEIKAEHDELQRRKQQLGIERRALRNVEKRKLVLPSSIEELRDTFERSARGLSVESPEFGDLMRVLTPEFHIYFVRLLDGGHLLPRARVKIDLTGCFSDLEFVSEMPQLLTKIVTLDLFVPPQRERIREEVLRHGKTKQREVAKQLSEPTFQVVVQKALAIDRLMKERGLATPYEVIFEPPADYPKLRRYKNELYEFRKFDGYVPPQL